MSGAQTQAMMKSEVGTTRTLTGLLEDIVQKIGNCQATANALVDRTGVVLPTSPQATVAPPGSTLRGRAEDAVTSLVDLHQKLEILNENL